MKNRLLLLLVCSPAAIFPAHAQTPPPPAPTPSLVQQASELPDTPPAPEAGSFSHTVLSYFTSFNPELETTFDARGKGWVGADSIQGGSVPLANSIGLSYQLYKWIGAETVTRNGGVAGTIISQSIGLQLQLKVHDVAIIPYVDGVYDFDDGAADKQHGDRFNAEFGVRVMKALTEHTYAGVGVGAQVPANRQIFSAFAGFTF